MSEAKLLPCPWCGKSPSIVRSGPSNLVWYIECDENEPAEHVVTIQTGSTRAAAIAAWNTRVDPVRDEMYKALKAIVRDLPMKRDWLDPMIEARARAVLDKAEGRS